MKGREYFLGLDLGTGSVGWCVTDTDYHILKGNRKPAIGSVLFSTAETAKGRRLVRCARRRLKRQQERIRCLQELFAEEIGKVDAGFFHRLSESPYVREDKRNADGSSPELPYALFVDREYTDKEYHRQYPTIYHLRKELMDQPAAHDIRLVYLAIAHILKHRGHFLSNIDVEGKGESFEELVQPFLETWNSLSELEISLQAAETEKLRAILTDQGITKSEKKDRIVALLQTKEKQGKELAALLVGASVSLEKLFGREEYKNLEENKLQFDSAAYEEKEGYYQEALGDSFELIARAKAIYNWCALSRILKNSPQGRISDAKVADYEKHRKDLRILKKLLREKCTPDVQKKILSVSQKGLANYPAYIGMTRRNGRKEAVEERCSGEDFYKLLEKEVLKNLEDCEEKRYIRQQISLGQFLPKQKGSENSVIPYQIHEKELKQILKNAEGYLPFLKEKDGSSFTVSEKILQLLTFRIPFYVGPLNNARQEDGYAWVVRREKGKVYPWNFEQKVDLEKSAEEFILRATNKCTYLKKEDVLPESSLLFEKYKVLNELNTVKIRGERLSVSVKQKVYEDLFCRHQRITGKRLVQYLKKEGIYGDIGPEDLSGIDGDFQSSLRSLLAFKQIHFDAPVTDSVMEDMIRDITLFGADQKLLKKRLLAKYPEYGKQIPVIVKNVKCGGWAPFSRKLLEGLAVETKEGEPVGTILYYLWNEQQNFNEILFHPQYGFRELIEQENAEAAGKTDGIRYNLVENLYVSPAVRRQIWMTLKVIDEVQTFMGQAPKRIFVEMAREKQESRRTSDRKSQIQQLYAHTKVDKELLEELKGCTNEELRRDKLFFYFMQQGRSAYTGKRIPFSALSDNSLYDIDHIYPRSLTADDSLDNRVLVEAVYNREKKQDKYPLEKGVRDKMTDQWRLWHEKKYISDEKYRRLTRTTELTQDELYGFVNRQLVETRQSTKALTELLHQLMPEKTEIVYVKAKHVVDFRHKFDLLKVRDMNDYHHAQDAYLNIVVGNVFHLKFTKDVRKYFAEKGTYRTYNLYKMFEDDVAFGNEKAWEKGRTIRTVKEMMANSRILTARRTFEEKGELYDLQRMKKGKGQVPLKEQGRISDIEKYGGYNKATTAYFMLIKAEDRKGKPSVWILPVPLYRKNRIEASPEYAKAYFEQEYQLNQVEILRKARIQTLFVYQGFKMRLAGRSGSQLVFHNANQLILPQKYHQAIRQISKYILERQKDKRALLADNQLLKEADMDALYLELCQKLEDSIYQAMLGRFLETYRSGYDLYQKLSKEKKAEALYQMLKLFQCTPELPDLTLIGGSGKPGPIRIGMNVTDRNSLAILHQSVTGIYERIERIV